MSEPLRILIVEDREDDAVLMRRTLERDGRIVSATRVDREEALRHALRTEAWDVILTDHVLPSLDSFRVLQIVRSMKLDTPVIVVSGRIGEENVVKAMREGAADYVSKDHLALLGSALDRALTAAHAAQQVSETRLQLVRTERLAFLGVLATGVAQEIGAPLARLRACLDQADELRRRISAAQGPDTAACDELEEAHERLRSGLERLSLITSALRRVSEGGAGSRSPVDLAVLADGILATVASRIPPDVEVVRDYQTRRPVLANEGEISQVVLTLVLNGLEAMQESGGVLTVRTIDRAGRVAIEVKDTGRGIAPQDQAKVFSPFFSTKTHGVGLGLSISYRVVEDHHGRMSFGSVRGKGTTFRVELPPADIGAPSRPREESPSIPTREPFEPAERRGPARRA